MTANIPPNPDNIEKCKKTCSLSVSYNISKCTVKNNGNHLSLGYDDDNGSQIVFNNTYYKVKDIKLYTPSVNKYNRQQAACELVIIHQNNYLDYLAVCIPINKRDGTSPSLLNSIISYAPHEDNGQKKSINLQNYSMSEFVPHKPFYYYKSKAFWNRNIRSVDYVVIRPEDSDCTISNNSLKTLQSIIFSHNYKTTSELNIYYSKIGVKKAGSSDDKIYIDCQPIPPSGEQPLTDYFKKTGIDGIGPAGNSSFVDALRGQNMMVLYVGLASLIFGLALFKGRELLSAVFNKASKIAPGAKKMFLKRRARKATEKASKATNKAISE